MARDDDFDFDEDSGSGSLRRRYVPNYLPQAILCTFFCCLPAGIIAIVFAAQVNGHLAAGNYRAAQSSSDSARTWCWVSFGVSLVAVSIGIAMQLAVGLVGR